MYLVTFHQSLASLHTRKRVALDNEWGVTLITSLWGKVDPDSIGGGDAL